MTPAATPEPDDTVRHYTFPDAVGPHGMGYAPVPLDVDSTNDDDLDDDGVVSDEELSRAAIAAGANDGETTDDEALVAELLAQGIDPHVEPEEDPVAE